MNESTYEMFKKVNGTRKKADKINMLRNYAAENPSFWGLIRLSFDPIFEWLLPEGAPPYKPLAKEFDAQNVLKASSRYLKYFINSPDGQSLTDFKRETMFVELLEAVDPEDAQLLIEVKDNKLPFKTITLNLIKEAFPNDTRNW